MQVGLLSLGDLITDPVTGQRMTPAQRHRSFVEQGVRAEAAGFTSVHLGEHHFCEYILSAPPIVLAAIAERTTTLRLSTGVTLGANLDPVRVAEDYATLDLLSGGRVEPVIGRGTFFPHTFAGFGQDPAVAKEVMAENVELLLELWTRTDVTWEGTHHAPLTAVTTHPRPFQSPPPVWIGGGASPDSVELAARLGLGLMLPTVFGTPQHFVPMVEHYLEAWERYGHDPARRRIGTVHHCFVAESAAEARRIWEPRYGAYIDWVSDLISTSTGANRRGFPPFDYEQRCSTTAIAGSPTEVLDTIGRLQELLHIDTILLMFDMGGLPEKELFEVIDYTGAEVVPQLRSM